MKDSTILALAGIAASLIGLWICLEHGINHFVVATVFILIGGLSGYEIKVWREKK